MTLGSVQGLEGSKERSQSPECPWMVVTEIVTCPCGLGRLPVGRDCLVPIERGLWDDRFSSRSQDSGPRVGQRPSGCPRALGLAMGPRSFTVHLQGPCGPRVPWCQKWLSPPALPPRCWCWS